jgi:AraC-like DNA-binding protein
MHTVVVLPDTSTTLVVRQASSGEREVMVAGPRTRAIYHRAEPELGRSCLQMRIRPGRARPLLGQPLSAVTDRMVPVPKTIAGLADELDAAPAAALAQLLAPTSANDRARSDLVAEATQLLSDPDRPSVAAVARSLHVSERHLRNLFDQAVGLSPKQFARIHRVRTVLARGPHDGLARAATLAGYYDQPHMTTEFRRLMGVPPATYLAGHLPDPRPCAAPPV